MPGRQYSSTNGYRYGFNGKEKDNKDGVIQYDYGFRIYDPRLVRFKSVDPLADEFPWYSPYHFAGNSPIQNLDIDGEEEIHYIFVWTDNKEKPVIKLAAWQVGTETGEVNSNGQAIYDVPYKIIAHYPVEFGDEVYYVTAEYSSEEAFQNAKAKDFTGSVVGLGTLLGYQAGDEAFDKMTMFVGLGSLKKGIKQSVKNAIEAANTLAVKEVKQLNKQVVDKLEKKLVTQASEKAGEQAVKVELKEAKAETKKSVKRGYANPNTREAKEYGDKMHKEFTEKAKKKGWTTGKKIKDPQTGKDVIPDAITPSGHPVELKPPTPSGRSKGKRQIKGQERAAGSNGRVIYYPPKSKN